jgi:hypothetical protein
MKRLDGQEQKPSPKQLDLFNQNQSGSSPKNGTDSVPDLTVTSTDFDTGTVADLGHYIKPNNKQENSVVDTHNKISEKNEKNSSRAIGYPRVSKMRHVNQLVTLTEVEEFFKLNKYPGKEAHKFYYYNQGKDWMLTDKIPIYDWKALAHKWMLNTKDPERKKQEPNIDQDIQYLYERFLEGEKIYKYILADYCDHLQLRITDEIHQEARQRRINQVAGSNEYTEKQLWLTYTGAINDIQLLEKDIPNLQSLTKRLAVLKFFEQLKLTNNSTIPNLQNNTNEH